MTDDRILAAQLKASALETSWKPAGNQQNQPDWWDWFRRGCCHGNEMDGCQDNGQKDGRREGGRTKVDLKDESETGNHGNQIV